MTGSRESPKESVTPPRCQHRLPALCPASTTPAAQHSRDDDVEPVRPPHRQQVHHAPAGHEDHILGQQMGAHIGHIGLSEQHQVGQVRGAEPLRGFVPPVEVGLRIPGGRGDQADTSAGAPWPAPSLGAPGRPPSRAGCPQPGRSLPNRPESAVPRACAPLRVRILTLTADNGLVIDVEPGRFEEMVAVALDGLPEDLGRVMRNVAVTVEHGTGPPRESHPEPVYRGVRLQYLPTHRRIFSILWHTPSSPPCTCWRIAWMQRSTAPAAMPSLPWSPAGWACRRR